MKMDVIVTTLSVFEERNIKMSLQNITAKKNFEKKTFFYL